jgi:signal transduction histidine kinase
MTTMVTAPPHPARPRIGDPNWQATAIAGVTQLIGLAIILSDRSHTVLGTAIAFVGVVAALFVLAPRALSAVGRHPVLLLLGLAVGAILVWFGVSLAGIGSVSEIGSLIRARSIGSSNLLLLGLMAFAAMLGLVLIADALRMRLGLGAARRAPWQQLTTDARPAPGFPWRGLVGVLLVGWAAFLAISVTGRYVSNNPALQLVLLVLVAGAAAVVIGTPLLIASLTRTDREQAGTAVEDERQRFAAHLHDSVLQTLALVQRQAHDPVAVARLARRQEHALRTWMAGETELFSETLVAALRDVVAAVEDEEGVTIELAAIGDRGLDPAGEALVAAAREALRNAARHGGGAAVVVFAEVTATGVEVFIRDEGPGFDPEAVPSERRGLRDAVIGRMSAVGGRASVESAPGEGTEIALRIGAAKAPRGER